MNRLLAVTAVAALLLTGCADQGDGPATGRGGSHAASVPADAGPLLAKYRLTGKTAVEIIDHLDRLPVAERPADLKASVRPDSLVISSGAREFRLGIPTDRFYLSVAPYLSRTHDCFYHSLTTCAGELTGTEVGVKVGDGPSGRVLVDEKRTTFANGFVGIWLPRDIRGTLLVTSGGKVGETAIATDEHAPTCLTTVRLT